MEVGNGGFSGAPSVRFMAAAVRNGYATASTDTGHHGDGADGSFALGHPEKVIDFGYRSEHETAVKAKAIIAAFYGEPQKRSYWDGCSSGGKQGLMEAQRYPDDFDGIIAGAPANQLGTSPRQRHLDRTGHPPHSRQLSAEGEARHPPSSCPRCLRRIRRRQGWRHPGHPLLPLRSRGHPMQRH